MWTGKNKSVCGAVRYGMVWLSMILETCELITGTIDHTVMGVIMIMIMGTGYCPESSELATGAG
jgi:hypothetical protein